MLPLLLLGCIHRVEVTTFPEGATLYRKGRQLGEAPLVVRIPMFATTQVEAKMPGYRAVDTKLRGVGTASFVADVLFLHWLKAVGLRTKAEVELRLMPEHGPVGTWAPEDVP